MKLSVTSRDGHGAGFGKVGSGYNLGSEADSDLNFWKKAGIGVELDSV